EQIQNLGPLRIEHTVDQRAHADIAHARIVRELPELHDAIAEESFPSPTREQSIRAHPASVAPRQVRRVTEDPDADLVLHVLGKRCVAPTEAWLLSAAGAGRRPPPHRP